MPANAKYLTQSKWQRFLKISAGFVGGFGLSTAFHILLATWFSRPIVMMTSNFTAYLLWAVLFICAFIPKNGWKIWGIYLGISLICVALIYLHP